MNKDFKIDQEFVTAEKKAREKTRNAISKKYI